MISKELLDILCCPESHQPLAIAESTLVEELNQQIERGQLRDRAGRPVATPIEGGLVRADRKFLYPIRQNIPVLLVDEALPLGA